MSSRIPGPCPRGKSINPKTGRCKKNAPKPNTKQARAQKQKSVSDRSEQRAHKIKTRGVTFEDEQEEFQTARFETNDDGEFQTARFETNDDGEFQTARFEQPDIDGSREEAIDDLQRRVEARVKNLNSRELKPCKPEQFRNPETGRCKKLPIQPKVLQDVAVIAEKRAQELITRGRTSDEDEESAGTIFENEGNGFFELPKISMEGLESENAALRQRVSALEARANELISALNACEGQGTQFRRRPQNNDDEF